MNNLNSILIEGILTEDPEFSYTKKGMLLCKFVIASSRIIKNNDDYQEEIAFFDVTAWKKIAEICKQYLKKGRGVRIVGRLKQDRWKDIEGNEKSNVYIIADHVEFKPNFSKNNKKKENNYGM